MKDNLIPFPAKVSPVSVALSVPEQVAGVSERRLDELRHAFDEARKLWPLEMAELPEQNRKCVASTKR